MAPTFERWLSLLIHSYDTLGCMLRYRRSMPYRNREMRGYGVDGLRKGMGRKSRRCRVDGVGDLGGLVSAGSMF